MFAGKKEVSTFQQDRCSFSLSLCLSVTSRSAQVTATVVEVEATVVAEDPSSSTATGGGVTVVCDPPLETSPSLVPGESLECTAKTSIVQDDANRGEVGSEFYLDHRPVYIDNQDCPVM